VREELVASLVQTTLAEIDALDHDAAMRSPLETSITENVVAAVNYELSRHVGVASLTPDGLTRLRV
jgi:hypothetical protein